VLGEHLPVLTFAAHPTEVERLSQSRDDCFVKISRAHIAHQGSPEMMAQKCRGHKAIKRVRRCQSEP